MSQRKSIIILICANAEWKAILKFHKNILLLQSPFGKYFILANQIVNKEIIFFQTGCGKINSSAASQYVIDNWNPEILVNLGTCGGFENEVIVGDIITVNETVIYDIIEELGTIDDTLESYRTKIDISWIESQHIPLHKTFIMVSADKDIDPDDIEELKRKYKAVAADWESGSIAYIAIKNNVKCLIQRGVSDIVGKDTTEIYGNYELFEERVENLINLLLRNLEPFLNKYIKNYHKYLT